MIVETAFEKYANEMTLLPYSQRMRLLQRLADSLSATRCSEKKRDFADFEAAFGMWEGREVSLDCVREGAWKR